MSLNFGLKLGLVLFFLSFFSVTAFADSSYDRELIVQDKTRAMKVESTFKELMAAYEDEDARGFLDLVSDERFRQDYITFTDALYSDFRNYEIHHVDYWIDRVVPDHVKQFLYVRWEKRYENLDDGQQLTTTGSSRFLFDDVDGKYQLVELAGNNLFGGSLQEWTEEVPQIAGQEVVVAGAGDLPDLIVTYVSDDGYIINYTVQNIGTAPSSECQIDCEYTPIFGGPPIHDTGVVAPLAVGEVRSGTLNADYPTSITLTIDSTNVVAESNEDNNTSSPVSSPSPY